MARLTPEQRESILSDYHIGKSQNELAKKYDCSPATINRLCKGIEPKYKEKVNTVATIRAELAGESEYQSECFDAEVNSKTKHLKLINDNATLLAGKITTMAQQIDSPNDLKTLVDANDRLAITMKVADRHAPKIDITQQTAVMPQLQIYAPEKDEDL